VVKRKRIPVTFRGVLFTTISAGITFAIAEITGKYWLLIITVAILISYRIGTVIERDKQTIRHAGHAMREEQRRYLSREDIDPYVTDRRELESPSDTIITEAYNSEKPWRRN
jgi:hypothetical protein